MVHIQGIYLPSNLGIDELMLGHQCRCILTDAKSGELVELVPSREEIPLARFLSAAQNPEDVQVVCVDMHDDYSVLAKELFPSNIC